MSEHTANDLRLYSETTINELVAANWAMDDEIKKLKAENARLREAAERVVFECEADDDAMMPSVAAVRKLKALLGGSE